MSRAQALDDLFERLGAASDLAEGEGIAEAIERDFARPETATSELLMTRAMDALRQGNPAIALEVLDRVVALDPGWPEGWRRRAGLRFAENDFAGALEDLARTLALEPRHFPALAGVGFIAIKLERPTAALRAFRRALVVYPRFPAAKAALDKLAPEVEGRGI